jgi:membrane-associated protease RseP (regulator of RpoE activity)
MSIQRPVLVLLDAYLVSVLLYTAGHGVAGRLAGLTVEEVGLFIGPTLLDFRVRGVRFKVGCVPLGGYVRFPAGDEKGQAWEGSFNALHPLRRVAVLSAGPLAILALSVACLGPTRALRSFGRAFTQVVPFVTALNPSGLSGRDLLRGLSAVLRYRTFPAAVGVASAKIAAFNLLPLAPLVGGQILATLLGWRKGLPEWLMTAWSFLGVVLALVIMGYWLYTIGSFAMS